jgi:hypothetical protein
MREQFRALGEHPGSTTGDLQENTPVARLKIHLSRLPRGNGQPPKPRRLCPAAIRRLGLSAIVLLAIAIPAGVLFTLDYVSGKLIQKALEVQVDFHGSPVP